MRRHVASGSDEMIVGAEMVVRDRPNGINWYQTLRADG
jgi:hypothetical protein